MAKNRIQRNLNVMDKADRLVVKFADKYGVDKSDVVNSMIRTYRTKIESGEWVDGKVSNGFHVSKDNKGNCYYRIDEELDDWLNEKSDEEGIYKSDLLTRIILYTVTRAKRGDIDKQQLS